MYSLQETVSVLVRAFFEEYTIILDVVFSAVRLVDRPRPAYNGLASALSFS